MALKFIAMEIVKDLHSYLAYAVLGLLVVAVLNAFWGWLGKKAFTPQKDRSISLLALVLSHVQLLLGLVLYVVSANGFKAIQVLGVGGLNASARLLALEHPLTNVLAIVLITIGWSRHKRFTEGYKMFRSIALFYGFGLVLLLSRMPWAQWFAG